MVQKNNTTKYKQICDWSYCGTILKASEQNPYFYSQGVKCRMSVAEYNIQYYRPTLTQDGLYLCDIWGITETIS